MQELPETEFEAATADYIELTADLVSAYVANNPVPSADLVQLIVTVHHALTGLVTTAEPAAEQIEKPTYTQIKKSITPDHLISFIDGKPYKSLRRHLASRGLTPEAYRANHGLPVDYPMTSATYSAQRSELARSFGLGNNRKAAAKDAGTDETVSEAPKRRGRPPKAA